jgi:peptidoglycan/LPS O-acetylase OafA/YrhL
MAIATPSHLAQIQSLRGVAALLVMVSHLVQIEARSVSRPILPDSFTYGMLGVDLFFVISGFIMVFVTRDWVKPGRIGEFLFSRAARIYPLYWIVSLALFAVWIIRPELVFSSSPNQPNLLNSVLLFPSYAYPLLEVGWTLVYEMGFYFVFALLLLLPARARPIGLCLWGVIVALGLAFGWQSTHAVMFHLINPLTFEFLGGAAMGLAFLRWEGSRTWGWGLVIVGGLSLALWFVIGGATFEDGWPRVIRFTAPSAALVLGAALLDRHGISPFKPLATLGDWSYSLYLTHLLSLVLVSKIWRALGLELTPLFLILAVSFAILVSGLTYRIIEAPLHTGARKIRRRFFAPPDRISST